MSDLPLRRRMAEVARKYAETCTFARARQETWAFYERHIDAYRASIRADVR